MNLNYTDAEFMSAKEKDQIYKHWSHFLVVLLVDVDKAFNHFSERLYKHLSLHCGFIAHYNRKGFFDTYFSGGIEEFNAFVKTIRENSWMKEYQDINKAMMNLLDEHLEKLERIFENRSFAKDLYELKNIMIRNKLEQVSLTGNGTLMTRVKNI